jgi:hypothetical protein
MYRVLLTSRSLGARVTVVECSVLNSVPMTLMLLILKLYSQYAEPVKTTGQRSVFVHLINFAAQKENNIQRDMAQKHLTC